MKKLIVMLTMVLTLVACGNQATPAPTPVSATPTPTVAILETPIPEPTPSPSPTGIGMSIDEYYAKVAALTNEDGTGIIRCGMSKEEIMERLNGQGVTFFEESNLRAIALCGVLYWLDENDKLTSIMYSGGGAVTAKGLKIGDPYTRVIELYGEGEEGPTDNGIRYCSYTYDEVVFAVELFVVESGVDSVESMTIYPRQQG